MHTPVRPCERSHSLVYAPTSADEGSSWQVEEIMSALEQLLRATEKLPKVVDRRTHAALDYLTISAFLLLGSAYWNRNKRVSAAALLNAGFVLGYSMFTDYPGSLRRQISFVSHGKLDIVQAGMAALAPQVLGFDGLAGFLCRAQAMNETMVIGITDWTEKEREQASNVHRAA